MKASVVLTYAVILCCVIDSVCANLKDFVINVSHEIGNTFQSAWTKITSAIKRPVRIRRLGKSSRWKRTTYVTPGSDVSTIAIYLFSKHSTPPSPRARHTIPVISSPSFKSLVEWRNLQIPYFLRPVPIAEETTTVRATKLLRDPTLNTKVLDSIKARMSRKYGIMY